MNLTIEELILLGAIPVNLKKIKKVKNIEFDSRKLTSNSQFFFCLKGNLHDAHTFIPNIKKQYPNIYFIYEKKSIKNIQKINNLSGLEVEDTQKFLFKISNYIRNQSKAIFIAITGSNGKTSTKEILSFLLEKIFTKKEILKSKKSFNNHFGVPFTLLQVKPHHKVVILEVGTNHPKEIQELSHVIEPNYSVITTIQNSHLEFFKNSKNVAYEKSDILLNLKKNGAIFIPKAIQHKKIILDKASKLMKQIIELPTQYALFTYLEHTQKGHCFLYNKKKYFFPLVGDHQFNNFNLAFQIIVYLKNVLEISELHYKKSLVSLEKLQNEQGRLKKIAHPVYEIWDDSYNANLSSFLSSIQTLEAIYNHQKMIGFIGQMSELGNISLQEHETLFIKIKKAFKKIIFFTNNAELKNLALKIFDKNFILICTLKDNDIKKGVEFIQNQLQPQDIILIKGSNSTRLNRVLPFFSNF